MAGRARVKVSRWRIVAAAVLAGVLAGMLAVAAIGPAWLLARAGFAAADSRLVTGILVTGTADRPVVYATSSDPRIGGDEASRDLDLDTNSGMISRLTREDGAWTRLDLVRGLPRSEENHATNGLQLDEARRVLYVAQGGMTNQGAPSNHFAFTPEYALSGGILSVDLAAIGETTYDLPTLDDETRPGDPDENDPFGGNGGRNQARLVPGGPVQMYATGLRNPYDVVLTRAGRLYTIDNGAAVKWGGPPRGCTNAVQEGGSYDRDTLHLIRPGYFGGHANPTRGSTRNTFNTDGQSPVAESNPVDCEYVPADERRALTSFQISTNGIAEYTASNAGGALDGDLLAVSFDQSLYRIVLDDDGEAVRNVGVLHRFSGTPLDVTAQGDDDPFPGTIWVIDYSTGEVTVLEPDDFTAARRWRTLAASGVERQEVSFVELGRKLYLAGGRTREHQAYDPEADAWSSVADLPVAVDHVQAVVLDGRIYYVGGLRDFPGPAVADVQVYDPDGDSFTRGTPMPRPRGGGGAAVHGGRIYYAGGLHEGAAVPWFDVYDPASGRWSQLPDLPRARDHFQAVVVGERLYAIGGRDTDIDKTIRETDVYDFRTRTWSTAASEIPTPRGGYGAALLGGEIWVIGGETSGRAYAEVEVYDPRRDVWRGVDPMPTPRHGIQAAVCGGAVYVAAGGAAPYGERPTDVLEAFAARGPGCGSEPLTERPAPAEPRFRTTVVEGTALSSPTSLQLGPDGRLYVSEQFGLVKAMTVERDADGRYRVVDLETIRGVREIPNHFDDGMPVDGWRAAVRAVWIRLTR